MYQDYVLSFYLQSWIRSGSGAIKARRSHFWSQSHFSSKYSFTESDIKIKSEIVSLLWPLCQMSQDIIMYLSCLSYITWCHAKYIHWFNHNPWWRFYASLVCLKAQENIFCLLFFLHSFHVLELWLPGLAVFEQCQSVYFYHLTEPIHVQVLHAELWGSPREKTTS